MSNLNTLAIRQTLNQSGPEAAEHQLIAIGNEVGDEQLALIVQDLLPAEVADIVGEGDYTKPSIISHFVTPDQFLGALERFGARWGSLEGDIPDYLVHQMRQEVVDFVFSVILTGNEAQRRILMPALLADTFGKKVLILVAINEVGCPEFLRDNTLDIGRAEKGTWQELYVDIQNINREGFLALKNKVLSLYPISLDSDSDKIDPSWRFTVRTLRDMAEKATEHVGQENPTESKTKEVFGDV